MKKLLLTLSLSLVALPAYAADDLPPPRPVVQDAVDDLPPPRTTTRKPRAAPAEATPQAGVADDLPPPTARSRKAAARGFQPVFKAGVDDLLLEAGGLPDAPEADTYSTLRASAYVLWQPSRNWEFRAGARLDGMMQDGGSADHDEMLADYADTYVRYRSGDTRLTLGAQTIVWGRADEIPLADRVSRADLTRFVLDDLADRRRAQLAARWEQTFGDYKLDACGCRYSAAPSCRMSPVSGARSTAAPVRSLASRPARRSPPWSAPPASTRTNTAAAAAPCA